MCISLSLYIYIYIHTNNVSQQYALSDTTCLTRALFKSGEACSKVRWPLMRRNPRNTSEAVLDKKRQTSSATQLMNSFRKLMPTTNQYIVRCRTWSPGIQKITAAQSALPTRKTYPISGSIQVQAIWPVFKIESGMASLTKSLKQTNCAVFKNRIWKNGPSPWENKEWFWDVETLDLCFQIEICILI